MKAHSLFQVSVIILLAAVISIAALTLVYMIKDPNPMRILSVMAAGK